MTERQRVESEYRGRLDSATRSEILEEAVRLCGELHDSNARVATLLASLNAARKTIESKNAQLIDAGWEMR